MGNLQVKVHPLLERNRCLHRRRHLCMDSGLHVWDQCVLCGDATLVPAADGGLIEAGLPRFDVRAYARAMDLYARRVEYEQRMALTVEVYGLEYAKAVAQAMRDAPELVE